MIMRQLTSFLLISFAGAVAASDAVIGTETTFASPNGISERCVQITPVPGGEYSNGDRKDETEYCSIDLYAADVALCPKTWSTSPGMMIYDITTGPYANDRAKFERNACKEGKSAKDLAGDSLAKFKVTMNAKGTSGTYSTSPLLYYHFARYFDMAVIVPVAVWRSMDVSAHNSEVARPGLSISGHNQSARMNHAGWQMISTIQLSPTIPLTGQRSTVF